MTKEEYEITTEMTKRIADVFDEYKTTPAQNLVVIEHFVAYIIANFLTSDGRGESTEVSIDIVLEKMKEHLVKLVPYMVNDIDKRANEQGRTD